MNREQTARNLLSTDGFSRPEKRAATVDWSEKPEIPGYELERKLADGGMGSVWLATEQTDLQRQVAVKVIRSGLSNDELVARFNVERQALAIMSHPSIAKILGAGSTKSGLPYFAMEFVEGVPLTKYCEQHQLDLVDRLRLFLEVCRAVQHAHNVGVIHRDLKPSNVLAANQDGQHVCKIIDFGLAKSTDDSNFKKRYETQHGQIVGTLQYMSPEHADLDNNSTDTRSDIYGLGVILYEILTGSTPITREVIAANSSFEVLRLIREAETVRPSTRLSERRSEHSIPGSSLSSILRRDLDWIVLKSLEKNPEHRYQSVNNFADDIARFLSGDPVNARPPSLSYRFRKLVGKYRIASVVASCLALGAVATSAAIWFAWMNQQTRDELSKEKTSNSQLQTQKSQLEIQISEEVQLKYATLQDSMLAGIRAELARANWEDALRGCAELESLEASWSQSTAVERRLVETQICRARAFNGLEDNARALETLLPYANPELLEPFLQAIESESKLAGRPLLLRSFLLAARLQAEHAEKTVKKASQSTPHLRAEIDLLLGDLLLLDETRSSFAITQIRAAFESGQLGTEDAMYADAMLKMYSEMNVRAANERLRAIVNENPFHERATIALIGNLFLQGRYGECREIIKVAKAAFGDNEPRLVIISTLMNLAEGNQQAGRLGVEALEESIGVDGAKIIQDVGTLYFVMNESTANMSISPQAYQLLWKLNIQPSVDADVKMVTIVHTTRHPAFRAFIDCLNVLADLRLVMQLRNDQPEPFRKALREGYAKYPDGLFQSLLGSSYLLPGHTDFAIAAEHYRLAIESDSACIGVRQYARYARSMALLGQAMDSETPGPLTEAAMQNALELVQENDKFNTFHVWQVANAAVDLGRFQVAETMASRALESSPADVPLNLLLIKAYMGQNSFGRAYDASQALQAKVETGEIQMDAEQQQRLAKYNSAALQSLVENDGGQ